MLSSILAGHPSAIFCLKSGLYTTLKSGLCFLISGANSFGVNDTEVEYDQGNWKIYKKKNDELKIYSSKGDELPLILPENFIKEIIKWNDEKPN